MSRYLAFPWGPRLGWLSLQQEYALPCVRKALSRWAPRTSSIKPLIGGRSRQKEQSEPMTSASGQIHRKPLQIGERAVVEGAFVGSSQDHAGRATRLERLLPARRTQAPAVAGPQARKAELGHRRRKIIAAGFGKLEKAAVVIAQTVATDVFSAGVSCQLQLA